MARVAGVVHAVYLPLPAREIQERAQALLARPELVVTRTTRKRTRSRDLRPSLLVLEPALGGEDELGRSPLLALTGGREGLGALLRPRDLLEALGQDPAECRVTRLRTLGLEGERLVGLGELCGLRRLPLPSALRSATPVPVALLVDALPRMHDLPSNGAGDSPLQA